MMAKTAVKEMDDNQVVEARKKDEKLKKKRIARDPEQAQQCSDEVARQH